MTEEQIKNMTAQLMRIGFNREEATKLAVEDLKWYRKPRK